MRKLPLVIGLSVVLFVSGCSADAATRLLKGDVESPINIEINGKRQDFSKYTPFEANGAIMVPLRQIVSDLGLEIKYYDETADILLTNGNTTIFLHGGPEGGTGSRYVVIDGARIDMQAPVMVRAKTAFVPVSFIKAIGASDQWISQEQTIQLSFQHKKDDGTKEEVIVIDTENNVLFPGNTGIGFTWGNSYIGATAPGGKPEGFGTLYGNGLQILYQGDWKNGLPHGNGRMELSTQAQVFLQGEFEAGRILKGSLSRKGKFYYDGEFGKQILTAGKLKLPDGTNFKGTFTPDQKQGTGVIYTNEGDVLFEGNVSFEGAVAINEFTFTPVKK